MQAATSHDKHYVCHEPNHRSGVQHSGQMLMHNALLGVSMLAQGSVVLHVLTASTAAWNVSPVLSPSNAADTNG